MAAATTTASAKPVSRSGGLTPLQPVAETSEDDIALDGLDMPPPALDEVPSSWVWPPPAGPKPVGIDVPKSSSAVFKCASNGQAGSSSSLSRRDVDIPGPPIPLFQRGTNTLRRPYMPRAASYTASSSPPVTRHTREDSVTDDSGALEMKRTPPRAGMKPRQNSFVSIASPLSLSKSPDEISEKEAPSRPVLHRSQTSQSFLKRTFSKQSEKSSTSNLTMKRKNGEDWKLSDPSPSPTKMRSRSSSFANFKSFITGPGRNKSNSSSITNSPKLKAMLKDPSKVPDLNAVNAALDELRLSPDHEKAKEPYISSLSTLSQALEDAAAKNRKMIHDAMQCRDNGYPEVCRSKCIQILHCTDPPASAEMKVRACNLLASIASSGQQKMHFVNDAKKMVKKHVEADPELKKYWGIIEILEKRAEDEIAKEKKKGKGRREQNEEIGAVDVKVGGMRPMEKVATIFNENPRVI